MKGASISNFDPDIMWLYRDISNNSVYLKILVKSKPKKKFAYYEFTRADFIKTAADIITQFPRMRRNALKLSRMIHEAWIDYAVKDSKCKLKKN